MRIIILSRGATLYSTQSLLRAGFRRGHHMQVVDHVQCDILMDAEQPRLFYHGEPIFGIDAVIPRIGASVTAHGAAVIRQLEAMKVYSVTRSDALLRARDKLFSLQLLAQAKIDIPKTFYVKQSSDLSLLFKQLGGTPVVIKLLKSTHGVGVILAENESTARSVIEAFGRTGEQVIVQEFIEEAKGADIRAFVVGGHIVAAMKRQAMEGEFRSNLHRGATSEIIKLTDEEALIVRRSARVMGLDVAGVDLLRSSRGPLVMEVNASPGLEGIEGTSGWILPARSSKWCSEMRENLPTSITKTDANPWSKTSRLNHNPLKYIPLLLSQGKVGSFT